MSKEKRSPAVAVTGKILFIILFVCTWLLWLLSFCNSPAGNSRKAAEREYLNQILITKAPGYAAEKELAQAYWLRYPDVRGSNMWGENGRRGIHGAREHFRLHGKKEGRVWGGLTDVEKKKKGL